MRGGGGVRGAPSIVSVYQPAPQKEELSPGIAPPLNGAQICTDTFHQNDYYRTWQLRHGGSGYATGGQSQNMAPNLARIHSLPARSYSTGGGQKYNYEPVEHIYESPKFERREIQYYELDPSSVQADTAQIPDYNPT